MNSAARSRLAERAQRLVSRIQARLPDALRELARSVPVHCQDVPDDSVLADGFPEDLLGLFTGPAHGESPGDNPLPPQIFLYLDNLWDYSEEDSEVFDEEVRTTYLHELGHFFGWDEDEIAARGLD